MSPSPLSPEVPAELGDDPYAEGWAALNKLLRRGYSWSGRERHAAFLSCGPGRRFANVGAVTGLGLSDDGRAAASLDWDGDGDVDLLVTARTGPRLRLLENRLPESASRVALRPLDERGLPVVGARVELRPTASALPLVRAVRAGEGYLAQSSAWLHFAWGAEPSAEELDVVVHWPFESAPERFSGVVPGGFQELVRGSGRAASWEPPEVPAGVDTISAPQAAAEGDGATRIVMSAPVPLPRLRVESARGGELELFGIEPGGASRGTGRPILLQLWASWCAPCVRELGRLAEAAEELRETGVAFLALSVETGEERAAARATMERLEWPFAWGYAPAETAEVLDALTAILLDHERRLPIPASFLVDAEGRLRAVYLGELTLADVQGARALLEVAPEELHAFATPFPGRWRRPPAGTDPGFFEGRLRARGFEEAAREYSRARLQVTESSPAKVLHGFGRNAALAGDIPGALRYFRAALQRDPEFFAARFDLAVLLQREGRVKEAISAYAEALRLRPDDVDTHFNLGLAYLVLGDDAAVRAEVEWLRERRPELAQALEGERQKER